MTSICRRSARERACSARKQWGRLRQPSTSPAWIAGPRVIRAAHMPSEGARQGAIKLRQGTRQVSSSNGVGRAKRRGCHAVTMHSAGVQRSVVGFTPLAAMSKASSMSCSGGRGGQGSAAVERAAHVCTEAQARRPGPGPGTAAVCLPIRRVSPSKVCLSKPGAPWPACVPC